MSYMTSCPCCSGELRLSAGTGKATCSDCGKTFNSDEIVIQPLDELREIIFAIPSEKFESEGYTCRNCGAEIATEDGSSATYCAFCSSPLINPERQLSANVPDSLLPFEIDKAAAKRAFMSYFKKRPLVDFSFTEAVRSGKISGLYMPCRIYNGKVETRAFTVGSDDAAAYHCIRTDFTSAPATACKHLNAELMARLSPFDFEKETAFSPDLLHGYFAENSSIPAENSVWDAIDGAKDHALYSIRDLTGDSPVKITSATHICKDISSKYVLLPVWVLSCKLGAFTHQLFMNGQTGKIIGVVPASPKKGFLFFGGIAAAVAAAGEFIWMAVKYL